MNHAPLVGVYILLNSFVDGELAGTSAVPPELFPIVNNNFDLVIGGQLGHTPRRWLGDLDEIRIWTVARTPEEIAQSYSRPLSGLESGLLAYFNFDQAINNTYLDAAGGLVATVSGGVVQTAGSGFAGGANSISLDGTGFLTVATNGTDVLDLSGEFTLEVWFRAESWADGDFNTIFAKTYSHPSNNMSYGIVRVGSTNDLTLQLWADSSTEAAVIAARTGINIDVTDLFDDEWHHIAYTYRQTLMGASILGEPRVGQFLTADTSNIFDHDGIADGSFTYQWLRGGEEIDGANTDVYWPTLSDAGSRLSVMIGYTDGSGNAESLVSPETAEIAFPYDTVPGTAGRDNIRGTRRGDALFGCEQGDVLVGRQGDDYLDGGIGVDIMRGGMGDDIYIVDDPRDVVREAFGAGNDTVISRLENYRPPRNVERVIFLREPVAQIGC